MTNKISAITPILKQWGRKGTSITKNVFADGTSLTSKRVAGKPNKNVDIWRKGDTITIQTPQGEIIRKIEKTHTRRVGLGPNLEDCYETIVKDGKDRIIVIAQLFGNGLRRIVKNGQMYERGQVVIPKI